MAHGGPNVSDPSFADPELVVSGPSSVSIPSLVDQVLVTPVLLPEFCSESGHSFADPAFRSTSFVDQVLVTPLLLAEFYGPNFSGPNIVDPKCLWPPVSRTQC